MYTLNDERGTLNGLRFEDRGLKKLPRPSTLSPHSFHVSRSSLIVPTSAFPRLEAFFNILLGTLPV